MYFFDYFIIRCVTISSNGFIACPQYKACVSKLLDILMFKESYMIWMFWNSSEFLKAFQFL